MQLQSETCKKVYSPARIKRLTADQTKLILIGHLSCGTPGARDLLAVLYPLPECEGRHDGPAHSEERPASIVFGTSGLIRHASSILQSRREAFRRFIRG